jgi:hypothetical protein
MPILPSVLIAIIAAVFVGVFDYYRLRIDGPPFG